MTLDEAGFNQAIEEQRNRARKTGGFVQEIARPAVAELAGRVGTTKFIGYDRLESESLVQAILKGDRLVKEAAEGDEVEIDGEQEQLDTHQQHDHVLPVEEDAGNADRKQQG